MAGVQSPPLPKECTGITSRACYTCKGLTNGAAAIEGCLKCAKLVQPTAMEGFYNGPKKNTKAETCAACYAGSNPAG